MPKITPEKENLTLPAPSLTRWVGVKTFFSQFFDNFSRHDILTLAAALAFYTSFSMAPILVITLAIVGVMGENSQSLLLQQINSLIGEQASIAVTAIINSANSQPQSGGFAGVVGVAILIFSASGVFAQFEESLNVIWDVQEKSNAAGVGGWIKKRILSIGMVLSLGFLALVSLSISTLLAFLFRHDGAVWGLINAVVTVFVFAGLFALIFKYLPDTKLEWKDASIGGLITAVLFSLGKSLIGLYLGKSSLGSAYGAAGSLVVLLAWIYYSSTIVFAGAELTRLLKARGLKPDPGDTNSNGLI